MKKAISILMSFIMVISVAMPVMASANDTPNDYAFDEVIDEAVVDGDNTMPPRMRSVKDIASLYLATNQYYSKAFEVLELVNAERAKVGLTALKMDKDLLTAAMLRTAETSLFFSHTRPNGDSWKTVSSKAFGENIAAGSSTAAATMNQWMNSQGHKDNILRNTYKSMGIGCVAVNGVYYWTQLFGTSEASVASANSYTDKAVEAQISIDVNSSEYKPSLVLSPTSAPTVGMSRELKFYCHNSFVNAPVLSKSLTFESSNTSIATVDASGNVKALKAGNVTISAYPKGKSSKKVQLSMTVAPTPTPKPTATATPKPTATATPKPTATPTPKPTATQKPIATAPPKPIATATPKPTATQKPMATATPKPTATQKPMATATPKPTVTAKPTATPKPTVTAKPTATQKPMVTAKPTATPKPASLTIKYNANGGQKAPNAQKKTRGKALTLSKAKPTRMGYTFKGWAESAKATKVKYKAGAKFNGNKNTTLYAVWTANKYTVSYNKNGGKGKIANTKMTYNKNAKLRANTFKRSGHKFTGWTVYRRSDKKWLYVKGSRTGWYKKNKQPAGYKLRVYKNKVKVKNLAIRANDKVTMYAQWKK